MIKNLRNSLVATLALAAAAVPGAVYAGTATATGSGTMTISTQCSVTGATVDLGTYRTNQTVADVANYLGYWDAGDNFVPGTLAPGAQLLGSVTCDNGMPYSLEIHGTRSDGPWGYKFHIPLAGKMLNGTIWVVKIGNDTLPDYWAPSLGWWNSDNPASGTGTGAAQEIRGNIYPGFGFAESTAALTDTLATPGTYSEPLTYTLNF